MSLSKGKSTPHFCHLFFRRKVTIFIGGETKTRILPTKINEKFAKVSRSSHNCSFRIVLPFNNNNNNTIWGGSVLTGEEPPLHSGKLKHALLQAGGPTQSQLSHPLSSGHHISMEHRQRRKQLNSDTNASNNTYLKEIQEKRKEETFYFRKNEK